jgi:hypothetical protein
MTFMTFRGRRPILDTYKNQGVHPLTRVSFFLLPFPDVRTFKRSDAFPTYLLPHFGQTLVLR